MSFDFDRLLTLKKGPYDVEKIVIVCKDKASDEILVELLNVLFPECEILAITRKKMDSETLSNGPLSTFHETESRGGRGDWYSR